MIETSELRWWARPSFLVLLVPVVTVSFMLFGLWVASVDLRYYINTTVCLIAIPYALLVIQLLTPLAVAAMRVEEGSVQAFVEGSWRTLQPDDVDLHATHSLGWQHRIGGIAPIALTDSTVIYVGRWFYAPEALGRLRAALDEELRVTI